MNAIEKSATKADPIPRPPRSHARTSIVISAFNEAAEMSVHPVDHPIEALSIMPRRRRIGF